jgi:hypothetical protein
VNGAALREPQPAVVETHAMYARASL